MLFSFCSTSSCLLFIVVLFFPLISLSSSPLNPSLITATPALVLSASVSAFVPSISESALSMSDLLWWGVSTDPREREPEGGDEGGGEVIVCAVAGWPRRLTSSLIHPVVDEKEAIAAAAVDRGRGRGSVGVAVFVIPSSPPTPDTVQDEEVEDVEVEVVEVEEEVTV